MPRKRLPPDTRPKWWDLGDTVDWRGKRISQFDVALEALMIMNHFDSYRTTTYRDEDWRNDPTYNPQRKGKRDGK